MAKLRGTMIGCGGYGRQLMNCIIKQPEVEMVAVTGRTPEKLKKVCEDYNVKGYFDYRQMYRETKPDFVFIVSPNNLHREHVAEAAKRGIHVFCEKPIAVTMKDADAMVKAVEKYRIVNVANGGARFSPIHRKVHEMIEGGELGKVMGLWERVMRSYGFGRHQAVLHPEESGGWIIHHAIHLVTTMLWFAGPAKEVYCRTNSTVTQSEENVYGLISFENGAHGIFSDSVCQLRGHGSDIICARAVVEFGSLSAGPNQQAAKLHRDGVIGYDKYEKIIVEVPEDVRYSGVIRHFFDCIRDRNIKSWSDMQTGREALKVAIALKKSADTGKIIKIKN